MDRLVWRVQKTQLPAPRHCPALRCRNLLLGKGTVLWKHLLSVPKPHCGLRDRSSSLLRAGARESWSHDVYEEIEFLIKKKSPDSVSLKNSVKKWRGISMNYTQFLADNRKKIIFHSFYEANITLMPKSDKDHKGLKTTGKCLLFRR